MTPPDDVSTRLAEIRERVEAATEGPWKLWNGWGPSERDGKHRVERIGPTHYGEASITADPVDIAARSEDLEFIAASRSDVPYLLSLVERYQKALLDWDQDVCWCGHPRIDHAAHDASPRCFIDGCDCEGYAALRDAAQEGAE